MFRISISHLRQFFKFFFGSIRLAQGCGYSTKSSSYSPWHLTGPSLQVSSTNIQKNCPLLRHLFRIQDNLAYLEFLFSNMGQFYLRRHHDTGGKGPGTSK
jgi:hypothetical protein